MNVLLFGYGEMGCAAFEFLRSHGERVRGVVTHRDDPGEKRWFRSLHDSAVAAGVPVFFEEDSDLEAVARSLEPEIILSSFFRKMLPRRVLDTASRAALNLHASLLPRLRGRAPLNWALVECEPRTGVTLHHMVEKPDAGDIVGQRAFDIGPRDTARTLFDKAVKETQVLLGEVWPLIRTGKAPRLPQDPSKATYRGRRGPEDGRIDWRQPTRRVDGLVRAVTDPFPGAFTYLGGRKLMVWEGAPAEGKGEPGILVRPGVVATADGAYQIDRCEFSPPAGPPALVPGAQMGA